MECILPDLTEEQNIRIHKILEKMNILGTGKLSPEICTVQPSKKNVVLSITPINQSPIVLKLFSNPLSLENELDIYTKEQSNTFFTANPPNPMNYAIPKLLHSGDDYIIMEYIQGQNLMNIMTSQIQSSWDPIFWERISSNLVQWVIGFSEVYKKIPLDCHVRNFILRDTTLYGLDFEELEIWTEENLLQVFVTLYFSILGAYPGIIEGLEVSKKAKIGILLLRCILLSPIFQEKSLKQVVSTFLYDLQKEAAKVVQRRINQQRGKGYNTMKIKENLDRVLSIIQSDFD